MSDRDLEKPGDKRLVIASEIIGSDCGRYVITDPEAPSIAEVVDVLREARELNWMEYDYPAEVEARIDNLIARLEDV